MNHQTYIVFVPITVEAEVCPTSDGQFEGRVECFSTPTVDDVKRSFAKVRFKTAKEAWAFFNKLTSL